MTTIMYKNIELKKYFILKRIPGSAPIWVKAPKKFVPDEKAVLIPLHGIKNRKLSVVGYGIVL